MCFISEYYHIKGINNSYICTNNFKFVTINNIINSKLGDIYNMDHLDLDYITTSYKQLHYQHYKYQSHRFKYANQIANQFLIQLISMFVVYRFIFSQSNTYFAFETNKEKFLLIVFFWILIKPVVCYLNIQILFIQFLLILAHGFCCTLVFAAPIFIWGTVIILYYNVQYRLVQQLWTSEKNNCLLLRIVIVLTIIFMVLYGICYGLISQCREQRIIGLYLILVGIMVYGMNIKILISFILRNQQSDLQNYKCEEFSIQLFFHFCVVMKLMQQLGQLTCY